MFKLKIIKYFLVLTTLFVANITDVYAKPIVADLAIHSVDINHDFNGTEILLFGARNDIGRIVVVLRGPERNYVVRKKEKIGGLIWMNRKNVEFNQVNSLYSLYSTNPLYEIKNMNLLNKLEIGLNNLSIQAAPEHNSIKSKQTINEFKEAFLRLNIQKGLYTTDIHPISFWGETLFRTKLNFPKNLERGTYTAEVYLFEDGKLSAVQSTPINVRKTGIEAFIFDLAHKNKLIYGVLCVLMAVGSGWAASRFFGRH